MNKLQIAQAIQREINSYSVGNPLLTTEVGDYSPAQHRQIIGWLDGEYQQLWTEQPWAWKKVLGLVVTTTANTGDYAVTTADGTVEEFVPDSFKIRPVGETVWVPLHWLCWQEWMDFFSLTADALAPSWPSHVTQMPDQRLRFTPVPEKAYQVEALYERPFLPLVGDEAVPPWHSELHDVLVYRTARNFIEEIGSAPMTQRVLAKLREREQTFINRYVP
jgi:hypothetical protein